MTVLPPIAKIAELLGGDVQGAQVLCPGPGHDDGDRSLSVKPDKADVMKSENIVVFVIFVRMTGGWSRIQDRAALYPRPLSRADFFLY